MAEAKPHVVDIRMHPNALRKHVSAWSGRVTAKYNLEAQTLFITVCPVGERWVIPTKPITAMKIARAMSADLRLA